ncbi:hypothetical protein C1634_024630 [Chryseobacterium viscerum]|uniref:Uncharacterized protein n=1 Tax=Chryseobacterium viscerum TaxID=1037377 RepID=A0A316WGJ1_9FLAO|nr:hypothetical protein C1634_024630 [Chryseobacterium viscerum]
MGQPEKDKAKVEENERLFDYHQKKNTEVNTLFKRKLMIKLIDKSEKAQEEYRARMLCTAPPKKGLFSMPNLQVPTQE